MKAKFKKCILHIGTEKTGTTSIQALLNDNRKELADQGYFVPIAMGRLEHVNLVNVVVNSKKNFSHRKKPKLRTEAGVDGFRKEMRREVEKELDAAATPDQILIVSSERLFTLLTHDHELALLSDILFQYCESVEIICYVRPQHEFAMSMYSTELTRGKTPDDVFPDLKDRSRNSRKYDYNRVLQFWQKGFPSAGLDVRRFTKSHLKNEDVMIDFMSATGIDPRNMVRPKNRNLSLNTRGQSLVKIFNRVVPDIRIGGRRPVRSTFILCLRFFCSGKAELADRGAQHAFYAKFSKSNAALQRRIFPDSCELFDDPFNE